MRARLLLPHQASGCGRFGVSAAVGSATRRPNSRRISGNFLFYACDAAERHVQRIDLRDLLRLCSSNVSFGCSRARKPKGEPLVNTSPEEIDRQGVVNPRFAAEWHVEGLIKQHPPN